MGKIVSSTEAVYRGKLDATGEIFECETLKNAYRILLREIRGVLHDNAGTFKQCRTWIEYGLSVYYTDNTSEFIPLRNVCLVYGLSSYRRILDCGVDRM